MFEQHTSKATEVPEPKSSKSRKFIGKKQLIIAGVILILLIGAGLFLIFRNDSPLPKSVVKQAQFTLYYPSKLPGDYVLQSHTVDYSGDTSSYIVSSPSLKKSVVVRQQALPNGFNPSAAFNGRDIKAVDVPAGQSYDLSLGEAVNYMIIAGNKTLIFLNSTDGAEKTVFEAIASSLKAAN